MSVFLRLDFLLFLLLAHFTTTFSLPSTPLHQARGGHTSELTSDAKSLVGIQYDYVIVGAGNAGLVVANRLSENPAVKVLLIEGGGDTRGDINVYKANETYAFNQESPLHAYKYQTVAQIGGTTKLEWFGKGLGGSTTVNGQVWNAPSREQLDSLEALGNPGWSFDSLLPYYTKAQDYHPPSAEQEELGVTFDPKVHRTGGPTTISHLDVTFSGPPQQAFFRAVKTALGVDPALDLQSGDNNGVAFVAHTLYPQTDLRRVSSATSYYSPIEGKRPNLTILLGWRAIKIEWDTTSKSSDQKTASGVTVQSEPSGEKILLSTSGEVILSAGTVRSPHLLEHSGVGDAKVLARINVQQVIDLPGVGRNFAEQCQVGINGQNRNKAWRGQGASSSIAQPTAAQIFASNVTEVAKYVSESLPKWAQDQVDAGAATSTQSTLEQYQLIFRSIFEGKTPTTEMFFGNGFWGTESGFSISTYTLTPFSRGYTHAVDADPWANPEVNPRYWTVPFDMDIEVASLLAAKKVFATKEMQQVMVPGSTSSPDCSTCRSGSPEEYAFFRNHVINTYGILDHAVGTCSMLPRPDGGVVDPKLLVYGTSNVRIIDASILPMQISAHPQATVYALAEKGADIVKQESRRRRGKKQ